MCFPPNLLTFHDNKESCLNLLIKLMFIFSISIDIFGTVSNIIVQYAYIYNTCYFTSKFLAWKQVVWLSTELKLHRV